MSREILCLFVLTLAMPAAAQPAVNQGISDDASHGRLTWTYPCAFVHADKTVLADGPTSYHCDYMHAQVKDADQHFNGLPTLAAQLRFLQLTGGNARAAKNAKNKAMADLLITTDPKEMTKDIGTDRELYLLMEKRAKLREGFNLCKPFLWPQWQEESYLVPTNDSWPESWMPCMKPVYDRYNELDALIEPLQSKVIDKSFKSVSQMLPEPKNAPVENVDNSASAKLFDGGGGGKDVTGPPLKGEGAPPFVPPLHLQRKKISDLQLTPPPQPDTHQDQRDHNYFARGYDAGVKRLSEETLLAIHLAMGWATTIGDPGGKASLIIKQKGPTCGVAAQYQALRARGLPVNIPDLSKEGVAKGYYTEFQLNSGSRAGGTYDEHAHSLLLDHGVSARLSSQTTPAQLVASIRTSGDAIVVMNTKRLWDDAALSDSESHIVYVSGAVVDAKNNPRGFYINDTGTGEAARFIPIKEFRLAWEAHDNFAVLFDEKK